METDPYARFEQVKVCGDTAATYLKDYGIEPTTNALIDALEGLVDVLVIDPTHVAYTGGVEGKRELPWTTDTLDLALADLLTWELYLGER